MSLGIGVWTSLLFGQACGLTSHDLPAMRAGPLQHDPENIEMVIAEASRGAVPKFIASPDQRNVVVDPNAGFVERHRFRDTRACYGFEHFGFCLVRR